MALLGIKLLPGGLLSHRLWLCGRLSSGWGCQTGFVYLGALWVGQLAHRAEWGCHQTGYQVMHKCSQAFQACGYVSFHSVLRGWGPHQLEARVLTLLLGLYFQKLGLWYYSWPGMWQSDCRSSRTETHSICWSLGGDLHCRGRFRFSMAQSQILRS